MNANQNTNITEKKLSAENVGTTSDGLGLIQLRVAIMQLRKEGKIVKFGNFGEGGVFTVIVPGLERVVDENGKTQISWISQKVEDE